MERLESFVDRLPPYLALIGLFGLLAAALLAVTGDPTYDRYAVPVAAGSLVLLLYYAIERPRAIKAFFAGRSARYGGGTLAMTVVFLAIVVLINWLAGMDRLNQRLDLTESKQFSLAPQTIKVLTELDRPVRILAFYQAGQGQEQITTLLSQFAKYNPNLTYEFIDPNLRPGEARTYDVQYAGTTIVESGNKRQTIMGSTEGDLISGIIKVTRGDTKKVYFLAGHGEASIDGTDQAGYSSAKAALTAENYKVEPLALMSTGLVPGDAAVVVLAAPRTPMQPQELQALLNYLDAGGKAMLLAEPQRMAGLTELADRFGVEIGKGVIIETAQNLYGDPLVPVVAGQGYLYSDITRNMPAATILPAATMVRAKQGGQPNPKYTVTPLVQTTDRAYMKTDLTSTRPQFDPAVDVKGPVPMAVTVSTAPDPAATAGSEPKKLTRIAIIGDADFVSNNAISLEGNRDFFVNSVNWLAEEESLISVRAKENTDRRLTLTGSSLILVGVGSVVLLPVLVLVVGAVIVRGRGAGRPRKQQR